MTISKAESIKYSGDGIIPTWKNMTVKEAKTILEENDDDFKK